METVTKIKLFIAGVGAVLTAFWGWVGWLVIIYISAMAIDWITGTAVAKKNKVLSSTRAHEGIKKKGGTIAVIAVALGADLIIVIAVKSIEQLHMLGWYSFALFPLVLVWYIVTEFISITENAAKLGAPIPKFLKNALDVMQKKAEETGDNFANKNEKE